MAHLAHNASDGDETIEGDDEVFNTSRRGVQIEATFNGSMRAGGVLCLCIDGILKASIPAGFITSTIHKSMRRARKGASLLSLVVQGAIIAASHRLTAAAMDATCVEARKAAVQGKAMLTQVSNRFLISFLEEGALVMSTSSDAELLAGWLVEFIAATNDLKRAPDVLAIAECCIRARRLVHSLVEAAAPLPRGRLISFLAIDGTADECAQAGVDRLLPQLSSVRDWREHMVDAQPFKTKGRRIAFLERMRQRAMPPYLRTLLSVSTDHNEYAQQLFRAVLIEEAIAPRDPHASGSTMSATPLEIEPGLPEGFDSYEAVVGAFGIKDVHTGQGSWEEFLVRGCMVEQESDEVVLGRSVVDWRRRYVAMRRNFPPERVTGRKRPQLACSGTAVDEVPTKAAKAAKATKAVNVDAAHTKTPTLWAMRFKDAVLAQLPTSAHKARVVMEVDEDGMLTGVCTKVFLHRSGYYKTWRHYAVLRTVLPSTVTEWSFNDESLEIRFPPLPGFRKLPVEAATHTACSFGINVRVIDQRVVGVTELKTGSSVASHALDRATDLCNFLVCATALRAMGVGDVSPRNFLVGSNTDGLPHLFAIDMSDRATKAPGGALERVVFVDDIFTCKLGSGDELRSTIDTFLNNNDAKELLLLGLKKLTPELAAAMLHTPLPRGAGPLPLQEQFTPSDVSRMEEWMAVLQSHLVTVHA